MKKILFFLIIFSFEKTFATKIYFTDTQKNLYMATDGHPPQTLTLKYPSSTVTVTLSDKDNKTKALHTATTSFDYGQNVSKAALDAFVKANFSGDALEKVQQIFLGNEAFFPFEKIMDFIENEIPDFVLKHDLSTFEKNLTDDGGEKDQTKARAKKNLRIFLDTTYSDVINVKRFEKFINEHIPSTCHAAFKKWLEEHKQKQAFIDAFYNFFDETTIFFPLKNYIEFIQASNLDFCKKYELENLIKKLLTDFCKASSLKTIVDKSKLEDTDKRKLLIFIEENKNFFSGRNLEVFLDRVLKKWSNELPQFEHLETPNVIAFQDLNTIQKTFSVSEHYLLYIERVPFMGFHHFERVLEHPHGIMAEAFLAPVETKSPRYLGSPHQRHRKGSHGGGDKSRRKGKLDDGSPRHKGSPRKGESEGPHYLLESDGSHVLHLWRFPSAVRCMQISPFIVKENGEFYKLLSIGEKNSVIPFHFQDAFFPHTLIFSGGYFASMGNTLFKAKEPSMRKTLKEIDTHCGNIYREFKSLGTLDVVPHGHIQLHVIEDTLLAYGKNRIHILKQGKIRGTYTFLIEKDAYIAAATQTADAFYIAINSKNGSNIYKIPHKTPQGDVSLKEQKPLLSHNSPITSLALTHEDVFES